MVLHDWQAWASCPKSCHPLTTSSGIPRLFCQMHLRSGLRKKCFADCCEGPDLPSRNLRSGRGKTCSGGPLEPQENDGEPSDGYTWDRGSAEKGCEVFAGQRTPRLRLFRTSAKERQLSVHRDAGTACGNTHPNALSNLRQWDLIQFPDLMDYSALA